MPLPNWKRVDPIPRGPAIAHRYFKGEIYYNGGKPRCPVCLKWKSVHHSSGEFTQRHNTGFIDTFHCFKCRVYWTDIGQALCFICSAPFDIPKDPRDYWPHNQDKWEHGHGYHYNTIKFPSCPACTKIVGENRWSNRSQLRRQVTNGTPK